MGRLYICRQDKQAPEIISLVDILYQRLSTSTLAFICIMAAENLILTNWPSPTTPFKILGMVWGWHQSCIFQKYNGSLLVDQPTHLSGEKL